MSRFNGFWPASSQNLTYRVPNNSMKHRLLTFGVLSTVLAAGVYPSEKSRLLNSIFTCELCGKNAMFNLNENNRIVMAQHPTDMRMGVNCLSGQVRMVGLDPSNGDVYIFVGKSRQVMKILHWEYGGYVVYYKRLEEGRFHPRIFLRQGVGFRSMKWSELVLLMEGISPKAARRHRYEKS